jgi:hypothetical protein
VSLSGLRGLARPAPAAGARPPDAERCELCGQSLGDPHGHVVDVGTRGLQCACRGCYLLFTNPGAAGGRRRAVPERVHYDPALRLSTQEWDELGIPVATAFFFRNSEVGRVVAFYPGPAGATESLLDLGAWQRLAGRHPMLAAVADDVEAVLVTTAGGRGREVFLVPIDVCYAFVGEIRRTWQGFDGGDRARAVLEAFLLDLRTCGRPLPQETS